MEKEQVRCIEEGCGAVMYGGVRNMDGLTCCMCAGPVVPEPYNPEDNHIRYDRKQARKAHERKNAEAIKRNANRSIEEIMELD